MAILMNCHLVKYGTATKPISLEMPFSRKEHVLKSAGIVPKDFAVRLKNYRIASIKFTAFSKRSSPVPLTTEKGSLLFVKSL